jgi:hypothetical protein
MESTVIHFILHSYHHLEAIAVVAVGYEHIFKLMEHVVWVAKKLYSLAISAFGAAEIVEEAAEEIIE